MLVVVSSILDQITALGPYRNFLPTHYHYAWVDALSSPIRWDDMIRGSGSALVYAAVFLGYAWLRFEPQGHHVVASLRSLAADAACRGRR